MFKLVIFLSQTESTPKHFFRKKNTEYNYISLLKLSAISMIRGHTDTQHLTALIIP
jgi:hypothetical protein